MGDGEGHAEAALVFYAGAARTPAVVGRRTANIVRYVGEWHSHPRNHSARASRDDVLLLAHLTAALRSEGLPALMLIIGETEERWFTGTAGMPCGRGASLR